EIENAELTPDLEALLAGEPVPPLPQSVLQRDVDVVDLRIDVGRGREREGHAHDRRGRAIEEDRADESRKIRSPGADLDLVDPDRLVLAGEVDRERIGEAVVVDRLRTGG